MTWINIVQVPCYRSRAATDYALNQLRFPCISHIYAPGAVRITYGYPVHAVELIKLSRGTTGSGWPFLMQPRATPSAWWPTFYNPRARRRRQPFGHRRPSARRIMPRYV